MTRGVAKTLTGMGPTATNTGRAERAGGPADVLWLDDPDCGNPSLTGGKASQLARLARYARVPPAFCLPAPALSMLLSLAGDPRDRLSELVSPAYRALERQAGVGSPRVAVRSSAVDEDGAERSFAGQHETYLNLVGAEAVVDAVLRCWDSGRSERALAYRRQLGLPLDSLGLAVLVQQLVLADTSAVVFSVNPVTGDTSELVVTATLGLGESLVGGTVTPDTWIVGKRDLSVRDAAIAHKERMTVAAPDGTREIDIPRLLRDRPALPTEQVVELARLARGLEELNGWPVDVEAAFSRDQLYLLQCRPVTAGLSPAARGG